MNPNKYLGENVSLGMNSCLIIFKVVFVFAKYSHTNILIPFVKDMKVYPNFLVLGILRRK
jgi:hypothetical protein